VIVFVRHGETPPNREGLLLGRGDPELTERGRAQAKDLALALAGLGITTVLTSPLRRARDTASPIAAECGVPVEVDERLIEIDFGEWEGQPLASIDADLVARWHRDPDLAPPGGESLVVVAGRVAAFCNERLGGETSGLTVAVSHVSPIKAAVTWTLGLSPELAWRMRLDVASLTRIDRGPVLLSFNETWPMRS
jgi:broad specificity phosphatase PhoE